MARGFFLDSAALKYKEHLKSVYSTFFIFDSIICPDNLLRKLFWVRTKLISNPSPSEP